MHTFTVIPIMGIEERLCPVCHSFPHQCSDRVCLCMAGGGGGAMVEHMQCHLSLYGVSYIIRSRAVYSKKVMLFPIWFPKVPNVCCH